MKKTAFVAACLYSFYFFRWPSEAHSLENRRKELVKLLSGVFPKSKVESLFNDSRLQLDYSVLPPKHPSPPKNLTEKRQSLKKKESV